MRLLAAQDFLSPSTPRPPRRLRALCEKSSRTGHAVAGGADPGLQATCQPVGHRAEVAGGCPPSCRAQSRHLRLTPAVRLRDNARDPAIRPVAARAYNQSLRPVGHRAEVAGCSLTNRELPNPAPNSPPPCGESRLKTFSRQARQDRQDACASFARNLPAPVIL